MKDRKLNELLNETMPDVPDAFHQAMQNTLAQIVEEEDAASGIVTLHPHNGGVKKKTAVVILVAALLLAMTTAALALLNPEVLRVIWGKDASMRANFPEQMQHDVSEVTVGDARVRLEEVIYDGVSLYTTYSIRDMTATELWGESFEGRKSESRFLRTEEYERISEMDVGWWTDGIWINGRRIGMPAMSGGDEVGGDEPGEIVYHSIWRLDQEDVYLTGKARVALPIGQRWPEWYKETPRNEDGTFQEPARNMMVFTIDADKVQGVNRTQPNVKTVCEDGVEIWAAEADFTPMKLYVTLNYTVPQYLIDDYCIAMGTDGWYNDEGKLMMAFGEFEVAEQWAYDFRMVDEDGNVLVDLPINSYDGCQGFGRNVIFYTFPYMDEYPSPLYIAPVQDGVADMDRKVLLRE